MATRRLDYVQGVAVDVVASLVLLLMLADVLRMIFVDTEPLRPSRSEPQTSQRDRKH